MSANGLGGVRRRAPWGRVLAPFTVASGSNLGMSWSRPGGRAARGRSLEAGSAVRRLKKGLYWLAVTAVAAGLVLALVYFFETRDPSQVGP